MKELKNYMKQQYMEIIKHNLNYKINKKNYKLKLFIQIKCIYNFINIQLNYISNFIFKFRT